MRRCLPVRYILCILGSVGMGIIYGLKVNFHVAIVSMVNYTAISSERNPHHSGEDGPFEWHSNVQGLLLSAYFWGYMISELPGGWIAEVSSGKWVMFFSVAINIVAAILSPLMANIHYAALIVMRVLQGLGGGVTFPAMHVMLSHWAPPHERSVMSNIVYAGTALGTVSFMLISGIIAASRGWQWVFYMEGGISATWLIFWTLLTANTPDEHRFITDEEKEKINEELHLHSKKQSHKVPYKDIALSGPFWAILIAHICSNWGWYMVLVELPLYMKTVLHFKLESNSLFTALPFFTMWIFSMILSEMLDLLYSKDKITITTARKIATGIASIGPVLCFAGLCFVESQTFGVILMTVAVTCVGGMFCGFLSNHIDISPHFAGTLVAVTNTFATIPGICVPIVVHALTEEDPTIHSWRILFYITIGLYVVEFTVYTIFGSGEEQPWNSPDKDT